MNHVIQQTLVYKDEKLLVVLLTLSIPYLYGICQVYGDIFKPYAT